MSTPPTASGSSSIDPYRGEPWAKIPRGSKADADKAVKAANEAMWRGPWSKMTASARGKVMRKLGDLVAANAERLAEIEVRDNGKLMAEMLGQLRYHPEWWWYFGGLADKIEGGVVPIDKPDMFAYTTHEPLGVVAALTAWNSPLLFVAWKCAAALAAGCAVIVKPSEFTSASTLEFAALIEGGRHSRRHVQRRHRLRPRDRQRADRRTPASPRSPSPARMRRAQRSTRPRRAA